VYITGEDAPLASVTSFNITLNSITLNGQSNSPQVLSSPLTVDFARLVGLRSPLGFGQVPPDTYSSATITLANPVIYYVDTTVNPPVVHSMNGTLTTSTVTVNFPTPMVVGASGIAGLHTEFDIRKSLAVDGSGQITGSVTPTIYMEAVRATNPEGQITDLTGSVVSKNTSSNSFVLQGPYGHQWTIDVNDSTDFNNGYTLSTLPTSGGFVAVQGTMQSDGSILASDVEFITTKAAFISGRILAINPASGPAQTVTMWVGETGANTAALVDTVQTVDLSAVSEYDICFFNNWFTTTGLFNSSSMLVGQRIFIGGSYDSSTSTFTPEMISLRRQGVYGEVIPGSVQVSAGNVGSFQMENNGLLGYTMGGPLTVETGAATLFFNGNSNVFSLGGLQSATATALVPVVTRGLIFKDPNSGNPVMWAHRVREVESQ
jgi:hypothetical protein